MMDRAVIFDCDGVLVNTETIVIDIELKAMAELGVPYKRDAFISKYLGSSEDDFEAGLDADHRRVHGVGLPPGFLAALERRRVSALEADVAAIDGAQRFAASLTLPRAVASSSRTPVLKMKLEKTGFAPLFGVHVHGGDDVAKAKPAPDLFLRAAAHLGVDPGRCVVIEDSVFGVTAARRAGMKVWGFTGGGHCPDDHGETLKRAGAAAVFEHFDPIAAAFHGQQKPAAE
ncbi:HAD family hydrolase [Maricaulaceae bacterium MS644]